MRPNAVVLALVVDLFPSLRLQCPHLHIFWGVIQIMLILQEFTHILYLLGLTMILRFGQGRGPVASRSACSGDNDRYDMD
jgi:hypothetical protein